MKIDEVMLGDIVSVSGRPIHVTLAVLNNWSDNIKPISLTPEILENDDKVEAMKAILKDKEPHYYSICYEE